jgi:pimeloyl-ACP methyl ester carboxylesterase
MRSLVTRSVMIVISILIVWIVFAQSCMTFRKADSEMKKKFRAKGVELTTTYQTVEGRHIHYAKTGRDSLPTIVFIHGTPGSWDAFMGYMLDSSLLAHYRIVSIDRPGFGYSDFGHAEHLQRQSQLMSPVLATLRNGQPMYLAGHSLGGPLIIQLAADNPGMCNGLVMISGSVDPAEEKPEKWRPWLFNTPLNLLVPGAFRPSNVELWYLKKDLVDLKPLFNKIECPVYFIHGANDTWVPPGNVEYAKKLLVNARHISELMIPDGNHFIPWTKHKEIRNVLLTLNGNHVSVNHNEKGTK